MKCQFNSAQVRSLAHQLSQIRWRPPHLRKGQTPLDALQNFARDLIAHNVAFFSVVKLLTGTSFVDTHHGDTDGPRSLADAQAEIVVVGVDIASFLEGLDDLDDWF